MIRATRWAAVVAAVMLSAGQAAAWHGAGHNRITRLAVAALGEEMPAFFRDGAVTIAHVSQDPDAFTSPIAPRELHDAEAPEHYFDLELLDGAKIPATRTAMLAWLCERGMSPADVGMAPLAVTEWTQRLTVALAEHRRWPDDPHIRAKTLVYAGHLAHYAEDLCQPLHTTVHYDGRVRRGADSPRTGIHKKVDNLPGKLALDDDERANLIKEIRPRAYDRLHPAVIDRLTTVHSLVDNVYALEAELPAYGRAIQPGGEVEAFTRQRVVDAARFTASLYLTAWRASADVELPDWHVRERDPADGEPVDAPPLYQPDDADETTEPLPNENPEKTETE